MRQPVRDRLSPAAATALAVALASFALPALAAPPFPLPAWKIEYALFALTLAGVAVLHRHTLAVGLGGLAVIVGYKLVFGAFAEGPGFAGLAKHFRHEAVPLANLMLLLLGFALLARHFEKSHAPVLLRRWLPHDWRGPFVLLAIVFVLSSFLDNIAAALIGAAMAHQVFRARVHIGYLAALVAAANAGGVGSVIGDTTTTMMWIRGVEPGEVVHAYIGGLVALAACGIPAAFQQQRFAPMLRHAHGHVHLDWPRLTVVATVLVAALGTNLYVNAFHARVADEFPYIGVAIWVALLVTRSLRRPDWEILPETARGSLFLLALVSCASLMPLDGLMPPSWPVTFGLGFLSAGFDNIPLTALALEQGGYDWALLAFAVGFGGSMIWFGSSAGIAVTNLFPEARSVVAWLRYGWHVMVAYVVGFLVMLATTGWTPHHAPTRSLSPTAIAALP